jgi:hypothetical protein
MKAPLLQEYLPLHETLQHYILNDDIVHNFNIVDYLVLHNICWIPFCLFWYTEYHVVCCMIFCIGFLIVLCVYILFVQ